MEHNLHALQMVSPQYLIGFPLSHPVKFPYSWKQFPKPDFVFAPEAISSIMTKVKMANPFTNANSFWHLIWKTFCHLDRTNSIKTYFRTCNLRTSQFINFKCVNQFWLNLQNQNGKKFFHIECQKFLTFANGYLLSFAI